jgi:hypothetical protein
LSACAVAVRGARLGIRFVALLATLTPLLGGVLLLAPLLAALLGLRLLVPEGSECRDAECSSNSTGRKATKNGAAAGAFIREGYGESVETILFHCGLL